MHTWPFITGKSYLSVSAHSTTKGIRAPLSLENHIWVCMPIVQQKCLYLKTLENPIRVCMPRAQQSAALENPIWVCMLLAQTSASLEILIWVCMLLAHKTALDWKIRTESVYAHSTTKGIRVPLSPRREAGDFSCLPPVWNLRAAMPVWSHFCISPLLFVCLCSPVALSVLSFSAFGPFSWLLVH